MITLHPRSKFYVLGFEVNGKISVEDLKYIEQMLKEKCNKYNKMNLLFIMTEGIPVYSNLSAFYANMLFIFRYLKHCNKITIVGNSISAKFFFNINGLIFGERYFDIKYLEKAWEYVEST